MHMSVNVRSCAMPAIMEHTNSEFGILAARNLNGRRQECLRAKNERKHTGMCAILNCSQSTRGLADSKTTAKILTSSCLCLPCRGLGNAGDAKDLAWWAKLRSWRACSHHHTCGKQLKYRIRLPDQHSLHAASRFIPASVAFSSCTSPFPLHDN